MTQDTCPTCGDRNHYSTQVVELALQNQVIKSFDAYLSHLNSLANLERDGIRPRPKPPNPLGPYFESNDHQDFKLGLATLQKNLKSSSSRKAIRENQEILAPFYEAFSKETNPIKRFEKIKTLWNVWKRNPLVINLLEDEKFLNFLFKELKKETCTKERISVQKKLLEILVNLYDADADWVKRPLNPEIISLLKKKSQHKNKDLSQNALGCLANCLIFSSNAKELRKKFSMRPEDLIFFMNKLIKTVETGHVRWSAPLFSYLLEKFARESRASRSLLMGARTPELLAAWSKMGSQLQKRAAREAYRQIMTEDGVTPDPPFITDLEMEEIKKAREYNLVSWDWMPEASLASP